MTPTPRPAPFPTVTERPLPAAAPEGAEGTQYLPPPVGKHPRRLDGTTGTKQPMIRRARRQHHRNAQAKASRRKNR